MSVNLVYALLVISYPRHQVYVPFVGCHLNHERRPLHGFVGGHVGGLVASLRSLVGRVVVCRHRPGPGHDHVHVHDHYQAHDWLLPLVDHALFVAS